MTEKDLKNYITDVSTLLQKKMITQINNKDNLQRIMNDYNDLSFGKSKNEDNKNNKEINIPVISWVEDDI